MGSNYESFTLFITLAGGEGGNRDDVLRERVFELKVERVEGVESVCLGLRRRVCVRVSEAICALAQSAET